MTGFDHLLLGEGGSPGKNGKVPIYDSDLGDRVKIPEFFIGFVSPESYRNIRVFTEDAVIEPGRVGDDLNDEVACVDDATICWLMSTGAFEEVSLPYKRMRREGAPAMGTAYRMSRETLEMFFDEYGFGIQFPEYGAVDTLADLLARNSQIRDFTEVFDDHGSELDAILTRCEGDFSALQERYERERTALIERWASEFQALEALDEGYASERLAITSQYAQEVQVLKDRVRRHRDIGKS